MKHLLLAILHRSLALIRLAKPADDKLESALAVEYHLRTRAEMRHMKNICLTTS